MKIIKTKNIVFVTGAFVSHTCWNEWITYFTNQGYHCTAPPWPFKDASAAELRSRQPKDTDLAALTLGQLTDHYVNIVKGFQEKPIVIGHSLGGLLTQIIVNRDLAAAGVAVHSVAPAGVFPYEFSFLKAGWKALGFLTSSRKTHMMSFRDWQYAFVNGMPLAEQKAAYEKYAIPESKTVARGGLTSAAKVDFAKPHAPLLFTAGSIDHLIPPHLNLRNYRKYTNRNSVTDYKEFEGRNHHVLGQSIGREDAAYIANWLYQN